MAGSVRRTCESRAAEIQVCPLTLILIRTLTHPDLTPEPLFRGLLPGLPAGPCALPNATVRLCVPCVTLLLAALFYLLLPLADLHVVAGRQSVLVTKGNTGLGCVEL